MTVAILMPVLDRAWRIEPLLRNIRDATPEPHRVIFAASDPETIAELDRLHAQYLQDDGDTWPNRINRLFHHTTEPYVFLGADDVVFYPGWLPILLAAAQAVDGVAVANDYFNKNGTLALVSRRYIEEQSGCVDMPDVVVYPGYRHNWSDAELFATAKARGRHAYCPDAVVEHLHPSAGKAPFDSTYRKGFDSELDDHRLFLTRQHLWRTDA